MSRRTRNNIPDRTAVSDDDPLLLSVAAVLAFPDGSMTVTVLRRERDAGRLAVERIGNRDYTTLAAIREMREKCLLDRSRHGSGTDLRVGIERRRGSSLTETTAIDACRLALEQATAPKPSSNSPATSPTSINSKHLRRR
jgi:hypothetical protein